MYFLLLSIFLFSFACSHSRSSSRESRLHLVLTLWDFTSFSPLSKWPNGLSIYFIIFSFFSPFHTLHINTVFGWSENREDGKHREENRVENSVFHCLVKERKWGGRKIREKVFSPGPTIFILPTREENLERKVL